MSQISNTDVKIFYNDSETGPAQYLGHKLARIVDPPLLTDDIFIGDIVKLTHGPNEGDTYPRIKKVVCSRFPVRTRLRYDDEAELLMLHTVFAVLGAESYPLLPPTEGKNRGWMIVGHDENIDPIGLAEALGVEQDFDNEDAVDQDDAKDSLDEGETGAGRDGKPPEHKASGLQEP